MDNNTLMMLLPLLMSMNNKNDNSLIQSLLAMNGNNSNMQNLINAMASMTNNKNSQKQQNTQFDKIKNIGGDKILDILKIMLTKG